MRIRIEKKKGQPAVAYTEQLKGDPRIPTSVEVERWMGAAEYRDSKVWKEIDSILDKLSESGWKLRVRVFRKELRWLRAQAVTYGMDWGRNDR